MINSKNCTVTIYIGETAKYKSEDKGKIKILSVGEYGEGISVHGRLHMKIQKRYTMM